MGESTREGITQSWLYIGESTKEGITQSWLYIGESTREGITQSWLYMGESTREGITQYWLYMGESTRERITPNILIFTYPIYTSTLTYIPWALNVAYLLPTLSSISSFISIGLLGCYTVLFTFIKLFVLFVTMLSGFTRRTSTSHIFISWLFYFLYCCHSC